MIRSTRSVLVILMLLVGTSTLVVRSTRAEDVETPAAAEEMQLDQLLDESNTNDTEFLENADLNNVDLESANAAEPVTPEGADAVVNNLEQERAQVQGNREPAEVAQEGEVQLADDDTLERLAAEAGANQSPTEEAVVETPPNPEPVAEAATGGDLVDLSEEAEAPVAVADTPQTEPEVSQNSSGASSERTRITNLEFQMVQEDSRVLVTFSHSPRYQEQVNAGVSQVVYTFENTEVPQRLQRAYDTTEFVSPVALFTLLQSQKNGNPTSKLILQLRENKTPRAAIRGNSLQIDFPPPTTKTPLVTLNPSGVEDSLNTENVYSADQKFTGQRIELLEIKDTEVQSALRMVAKASGYNIVIGDDVQGKIGTLSLRDIPWDQAFTLILQMKKLGYTKQGNVLRVTTLENLRKEKEEAESVLQAQEKAAELRTVLIPVSYAGVSDMADRVKVFLTSRGKVESDSRTNTLIVRDVETAITRIQKLITNLDTQPPRVSISAKIVEMSTSRNMNFAFNPFSFGFSQNGLGISSALQGGIADVWQGSLQASNFANLNASFTIGELNDDVRILANPTVTALNNKAATITQSTRFTIPAQAQGALVTGGPNFVTTEATLSLNVTPVIANDGSVSMNVVVTNDVPRTTDGLTVEKRNIQTDVSVENGDTAVIGGVYRTTNSMSNKGIPVLKHIPIFGLLFTAEEKHIDQQTEIVIFLTPRILNADKAFRRDLG